MPTSLRAIAVSNAEASMPEEPGAIIPHAGICGGTPGNRRSYPDGEPLRSLRSRLA
jgi:hypothetical protein